MPSDAPQAKPKTKLVEVAPAARPARLHRRHRLIFASFLLAVVTPLLVTAVYLYAYAADQYASTMGFTVRTEETGSALELLGGLSQFSSASSSDTDVIYKFIQSQELVEMIDAELDLRALYGKPETDPVFALPADSSTEELIAYWQGMVRVDYDPGIGLMEIESRAFDPEDARRIARAIFARSSARINELSAIAREDTLGYARSELDTAVERLRTARQALTLFRNNTQIVDPAADIQGQMGLLTSLNAQLAEALIELDILTETTREGDPRIEQTRRKIAVIERRIADEREKLGVGRGQDGRAYADLVGEFESLRVDLEFAENAYTSALSAYDSAVAEARRQSRYLAAYVEPTLAQTALYPQREIILLVGGFVLFGVWALTLLVYYSLRDRQ